MSRNVLPGLPSRSAMFPTDFVPRNLDVLRSLSLKVASERLFSLHDFSLPLIRFPSPSAPWFASEGSSLSSWAAVSRMECSDLEAPLEWKSCKDTLPAFL